MKIFTNFILCLTYAKPFDIFIKIQATGKKINFSKVIRNYFGGW